MRGLVRLVGDGDDWPDIAVIGEAEQWNLHGQRGKFMAINALNAASKRCYNIEVGTLPREWGPIGPALLWDQNKASVHAFYSGREEVFYARNRNIGVVSPREHPERVMNILGWHGDIQSYLLQLIDAQGMRRLSNPSRPNMILADWNCTLDGPNFALPPDFADAYTHIRQYMGMIEYDPRNPHGPHRPNTLALDYLCGVWENGHRVGGLGFVSAAERAGIYTPTTIGYPVPRQIDVGLLNASAALMLLPDTVRIHQPIDPANPDSDHCRLSFTIDTDRYTVFSDVVWHDTVRRFKRRFTEHERFDDGLPMAS